MAWHHEIKTVPEGISTRKVSDEAMVEARRETERLRRARRRDRQRANRRRPGRPAKAGVGMPGAGEAMLAGLARRVSFIEKLTLRQEAFLAGGEVAKGTYVRPSVEACEAIGRSNVTMQQCAATQAAQASVLDHVMVVLGTMSLRVNEDVQAMGSVQEQLASMGAQLEELRQAGAADAAGRLDATEREVGELRDRVEESRIALLGQERLEKERFAEFRETKQIGADLGSTRDDLEGIRGVVQGMVDNEEVTLNRVAAHGDLLKQVVRDINKMRPAMEAFHEGWVGMTVTLGGLQTAELNGLTGTVLRWTWESGRYEVDLGHRGVSVLHDNLRPAQGT